MKTSYTDFYEYYLKLSKRNDFQAVKQFKKILKLNKANKCTDEQRIDNWSDLEFFLGRYLGKINTENEAIAIHSHLIEHLPKHIESEENKCDIDESQKESFLKYLREPKEFMDNLLPSEKEEIERYVSSHAHKELDIKIITFNYTKSIGKILGDDISSIDLEHIHGFTYERLVLGVNDIFQMVNEPLRAETDVVDRYVKTDCNDTYGLGHDKKCQDWIKDADLICLFGLSIGYSDKKWWDLVSKRLQNECKVIIYEYSNKEFNPNEGPDIKKFKNDAKSKFLTKTDIGRNLKENDNLEKNIYVSPSNKMFKFDIKIKLKKKIKQLVKQTAVITGITVTTVIIILMLIIIIRLAYPTKNEFIDADYYNPQQDGVELASALPPASTLVDTTPLSPPIQKLIKPRITAPVSQVDFSALRSLGEIYEADNKPVLAAKAYSDYVAIQGVVDQEASFKRAFLIEKTDEAQAIKYYKENLKTFPKDARNFVRLGLIQSQKKETMTQAAANLNAAVKLVDNDADVWLALAKVNSNLNRTNEELAAYRRYVQLNPQDFSANRRMGEIFHSRKQFQDAITNLEIFLATTPNDVEVILMLADAYEGTNRQAKAAEFLTKAKTLKPDDPKIRERLYLMYKKEGQKAKAEAEIKDLVNMTKDNRHRLMYFNNLVEANKLDEAAKIANDIRRSDPLNYEGSMAVADIQRLQRRFAEAVETYKSVLFLEPPKGSNYAAAFYGRAEAHLGMREIDRAEAFFKRAIEVEPKMARAHLGLAKVYKAQNKTTLMNTHANRAKTLEPNNKELIEEINRLIE